MANRQLIEKLIGMLGSDHTGEVFNAAQKLVKIAKEEKKTLVELLVGQQNPHVVHASFGYKSGPDVHFYEADVQYNPFKNNMAHVEIRNKLKQIRLNMSDRLNIWEKEFIDGIDIHLVRYGALTGKQLAAAHSILSKFHHPKSKK
jgi:hypothetical protein